MDMPRKIRALANKLGPGSSKTPTPDPAHNPQGMATLIVMIAVLGIIVLFCCFAAPGVRDLCKRYVFRCCFTRDSDDDNASAPASTPTIILLPYGRMLVVDRTVFARLRADHTGIDFLELSANLIRAQTPPQSSGSTSKGLTTPCSPPAYEDIFSTADLPPSYSEVSLMIRQGRIRGPDGGLSSIVKSSSDCCGDSIGDGGSDCVRVHIGQNDGDCDDNDNDCGYVRESRL